MKRSARHINKFITSVDAIDTSDKKQNGYVARAMVQATLPHSRQLKDKKNSNSKEIRVFQRTNGNFTISIVADPAYGLPYGAMSRLILAWVTTESVRRKTPVLKLGNNLKDFLKQLGLSSNGGKKGDPKRLRDHMLRLFTAKITYVTRDKANATELTEQFLLARNYQVWWNPLQEQSSPYSEDSTVTITLSKDFYEGLIATPVPVSFKALQALQRSPLQMDIYTWLTWRMFDLKRSILIPWKSLKHQFGANYANNDQGTRDFKKKFLDALRAVRVIYEKANVEAQEKGLMLYPSPTHVPVK